MIYERILPSTALNTYIESYWIIDSQGDSTENVQKIVPDGFPELIFHYGDPYRINLTGNWEKQSYYLLAGQISNHFHLSNTGVSGMIGIKFMPTALHRLFGLDMSEITNQVVPLQSRLAKPFESLNVKPSLNKKEDFISAVEDLLQTHVSQIDPMPSETEQVVSYLLEHKGLLTVSDLCQKINKSERQLERLFLRHIGLSPKFYSRIIRLGHIFELMQAKDSTWSDLVYQSGFYDQSHFIKNFKEFTGEDPSSYGFNERNMANFHMKK